jgi:hypothetical protein
MSPADFDEVERRTGYPRYTPSACPRSPLQHLDLRLTRKIGDAQNSIAIHWKFIHFEPQPTRTEQWMRSVNQALNRRDGPAAAVRFMEAQANWDASTVCVLHDCCWWTISLNLEDDIAALSGLLCAFQGCANHREVQSACRVKKGRELSTHSYRAE